MPRPSEDPSAWRRLAVEQAAVGIVQLSPDGALLEVNPGFCRILGYDARELRGRALASLLHPDDVDGHREWAARALAGDVDAWFLEQRALRKDGATVWLDTTYSVARDEAGRLAFSVAVVQDASARRSAERTLQQRALDFFAAFDVAHAPLAQTEFGTGRFLRVNPRFCELTGYAASELLEMSLEGLAHPEDRTEGADLVSGFGSERRYLRKDGSTFWALVHASPMRQDGGRIARILSSWVDVSERKQAEEALRLSEARFRTLAEAGAVLVYSSDAEGQPSYLGPSLTRYLGLRLEDVRQEEVLRRIVHPEDHPAIAALRAREPDVAEAELRLRRADGVFRWFLARSVVLKDDAGRFVQRIGSLVDIDDRKQAELAVARSEERFRLASEAVDGLIYDVDLASGRVFRSPGISRMLGFAPEDSPLTIEAWEERVHPEDREDAGARVAEAIRAGLDAIALEYRVRHKTGHWIDLWDNRRILRDASGKPVRIVGHAIDVTSRRRAEEALRSSERRLAALANATPAMVWTTDASGAGLSASEAWQRYTGLPTSRRARWSGLLHPDDQAPTAVGWERALAEQRGFEIENRLRRHDGEYRWYLTRALPLRDEGGTVTGWMGASIDIHELKIAQAALQESEERFRMLADGAPVLIWLNGLEGCEFVNLAYKEFLGVGDDEVRGFGWARFVHPDDRDGYVAAFEDALGRRVPFRSEFRFRRRDGEYRWMVSAGSPRFGPSGELLGYVGSTLDITERKLAESALREADRRKDEFLATLAHELRNPLAPIRNAVEVLRFEQVSHPRVEWARDLIDRQVDQLTRLVEDLLDVSRITGGILELRAEPLTLADLVREVVETSRALLATHRARIEVCLPEEPIALRGDRVRLAQVLANLIDNAAKHSHGVAPIELSAERDGSELRLSVRDGGTGMTPEELSRVFEMFYQAGDRSQRKPGLGVGLALVKSLVELHGGSVEARSDGLGKGSTFVVRLPLREAVAPDARAVADEPAPAPCRRVLVVDDNRDSATSLATLVELLGHRVETAGDGLEALEVAERFLPEVVLLDLGLPRLDGYAAARRIRSAPWGAGMLLVAQTGWGQEADRALASEAGFDHHLVKPVDLAALRAILAGAREGGA